MNPCPDLSTLDDVLVHEREAHLASCSACRMLFALRDGGHEEFGEECETAETLLAAASDTHLNAIDQRRLSRHLESCDRCTGLAGELLLLDGATSPEDLALTKAWEPVAAYAAPAQPANDQRSRLFYGLALLTAAAAAILIVRGILTSDEGGAADSMADVTPERQSKSLASETPAAKDEGSEHSAAGASRPAPVLPVPPALSVAELMAKSTRALRDADYATGLELCRSALKAEPDNQEAHTNCGLAACNLGDAVVAGTHIDAITSESRAAGLTQICLRLGVKLKGAPTESADELVNQAEDAVKNTNYHQGLRYAQQLLKRDPKNQRASTAAAIAACNLKRKKAAKKYIANVESSQRRQGLMQICIRLGIKDIKSDDRDASGKVPKEPTDAQKMAIEKLVAGAENTLRSFQYGKGAQLCRQALELDPNNQRALTACAIASCNLKNSDASRKYIRRVKSSQRRQGLKQICLRLGVTGLGDLK